MEAYATDRVARIPYGLGKRILQASRKDPITGLDRILRGIACMHTPGIGGLLRPARHMGALMGGAAMQQWYLSSVTGWECKA